MDGFDDRAFIDAYKRLATGTPGPGDIALVQSVRDSLAAQGEDTAALDALLGGTDWTAQASALTPSTAPSVADQVAASMAAGQSMGMGQPSSDPAVDWMQQQPGSTAPPLPTLPDLAALGEGGNALTRQAGWGDRAPTTTDGAPDLAAQTARARARRGMDPTLPIIPSPTLLPGNQDLERDAVTVPGGPRLTPDLSAATPDQDFLTRAGRANPELSQMLPGGGGTNSGANPLPDRGGANDRRQARGDRTDWQIESEAIGTLPGESAFAGIESGMLPSVQADPALAARLLSRARGAGDAGGRLLEPQVAAIMALNQTGVLGGKRGVGPQAGLQGPAAQLQGTEALLNDLGPGSYLDPQTLHRQTLRNIRKTDPTTMFAGGEEGQAGDVNHQIAVTNSALMAETTATMTEESRKAMQARLLGAEQDYIMGVVDGSIIPAEMSYPEYLRRVKKVRKWVGPGTTPDQWQQAFATD